MTTTRSPAAAPAPASPRAAPRRTVSRRSFVASLGLAAIAAPFARLVTSVGRAQAAAGPTAKRLVVFFTPNGTVPARWRPSSR